MYLMIDNYDSFTYNLCALFTECGVKLKVIRNNEYEDAANYTGIIISPGPSTPDHAGTSLDYLKNYMGKKPIFGVCLGMQSMGYVLGYEVKRAATIQHGKVDVINVTGESVIYKDVPKSFNAVRYHSLGVVIDGPMVTSRSQKDNTVMSIENVDKMIFGVQYHPESILSEYGDLIVKNFIKFAEGVK